MKIDLSNAKEKQVIKGWGASACWWAQACPKGDTADKIADLLYSDKGLGLNIYRYNVGGGTQDNNCRIENPWRKTESFMDFDVENEKQSWDFTKDSNAVNMMKICLERGNIDTLILFANSPHWSLCSNAQASGSFLYHTCNIPKMNYCKFADYLLDITEYFLNEGYPVKYISPINEPQWKWGGPFVWQEGCHYETEELVEIYHIFAEKIIERNLPVKLYGPESGEMLGLTGEYLNALYNDDVIMQVLDVFAYHSYHSDNSPDTRRTFKTDIVDKYPDMRFDMSEWCELPNKSHTKDFKGALITARIIGQDLSIAGAQSWTSWVAVNNFALKEDGLDYSDALITADFDFTNWYVAKRYYGLAHYSKYISIGSKCLDLGACADDENNDFNVFGFLTPNNETVLVIVNEREDILFELNGKYSSMKIVTSVDNNELKTTYNGKCVDKIKSPRNSIMTVILKL